METWGAGTYHFVACKDCNFVVSFDSKLNLFDTFHLFPLNQILSFYIFLKISEYDQMVELIGIPWITFLKNNKCGKCENSPWEAIFSTTSPVENSRANDLCEISQTT